MAQLYITTVAIIIISNHNGSEFECTKHKLGCIKSVLFLSSRGQRLAGWTVTGPASLLGVRISKSSKICRGLPLHEPDPEHRFLLAGRSMTVKQRRKEKLTSAEIGALGELWAGSPAPAGQTNPSLYFPPCLPCQAGTYQIAVTVMTGLRKGPCELLCRTPYAIPRGENQPVNTLGDGHDSTPSRQTTLQLKIYLTYAHRHTSKAQTHSSREAVTEIRKSVVKHF